MFSRVRSPTDLFLGVHQRGPVLGRDNLSPTNLWRLLVSAGEMALFAVSGPVAGRWSQSEHAWDRGLLKQPRSDETAKMVKITLAG